LPNDAFWRVSADTKTCVSPLYNRRLLAVYVSLLAVYVNLLANMGVLYQISSLISSRFEKNLRDTALYAG